MFSCYLCYSTLTFIWDLNKSNTGFDMNVEQQNQVTSGLLKTNVSLTSESVNSQTQCCTAADCRLALVLFHFICISAVPSSAKV